MRPQDFLAFRSELAPASGFQSVQFRAIEFLSGLRDRRYLERLELTAPERAVLEQGLTEPSLWDAWGELEYAIQTGDLPFDKMFGVLPPPVFGSNPKALDRNAPVDPAELLTSTSPLPAAVG